MGRPRRRRAPRTRTPLATSRLRAAAELVETVAAATKKYEDIRAALVDGYAQTAQDVRGIAAHF